MTTKNTMEELRALARDVPVAPNIQRRLAELDAARREVADFAAYCVGSAHDDWDPRVDAEYDRVMSDDRVYEIWRKKQEDVEAARKGPGGYEICVDRDEDGLAF